MKKMVWDDKIWKEKLAELPVESNMEHDWKEMDAILDKNLAQTSTNVPAKNNIVINLIQVLKFAIVVLSVTGVTYLVYDQMEAVVTPQKIKKEAKHSIKPKQEKITDREAKNEPVLANEGEKVEKNETTATAREIEKVQDNVVESSLILGDSSFLLKKIQNINHPEVAMSLKTKNLTLLTSKDLNKKIQRKLRRELKKQRKIEAAKARKAGLLKGVSGVTDYGLFAKEARGNKSAVTNGKKINSDKSPSIAPKYGLEILGGGMFSEKKISAIVGLQGYYALNKKWLLGSGLRFIPSKTIEGTYEHASYSTIMPATPFQIKDTRKVAMLDVPLTASYKIARNFNLKAGGNFSFIVGQKEESKVGYVANYLDTVFHSKQIASALAETSMNKFKFGLIGGLEFNMDKFKLETFYQHELNPYSISSSLGGYQKRYRSVGFTVAYKF